MDPDSALLNTMITKTIAVENKHRGQIDFVQLPATHFHYTNIGGPLNSLLLRWNFGQESVVIEAPVLGASLSIVLCIEDVN